MRARTLATLVAVATLLGTRGAASADSQLRDLRDPLTVKPVEAIKTLRADAAAKVEQSASAQPEPKEPEREVRIEPVPSDSGEPYRERWHHDRLGWIGVGTGVVVAAAGTALIINASLLRSDADDALDANERVRLRNRADTRETLGIVAIGVGAAAVIAGAIKLAIVPSEDGVGVALAPSTSGLSFTVHARW